MLSARVGHYSHRKGEDLGVTPTVQRRKGKEGWKETFLNHQRSWVEGSEKTL